MRIPSSLSGRLTAVFAGAAALLVAAAGLGMGALIERAFWAALDGQLFEEAETLALAKCSMPPENNLAEG